ncbi:YlaH-like protein [Melghirimyces profundicolus]|uniref:YlaH-like protein n=1 Tax=Melghirimyces profundicolus TaxID=1242148 RepID=A0A2T6C9Q8_9BACL|nr:YlaH-like family protein [Melghirimyces profundicolus]PTX65065.1 YlaH-like protein [Melghirimyces profundicolus]
MEEINAWLRSQPPVSYLVILAMTAVVYKVAFARKLPVLKSFVVYVVLAIGCVLLWGMFYLRFPIIEILAITLVMIAAARIRMWMGTRKKDTDSD